jgi:predicted ATPase
MTQTEAETAQYNFAKALEIGLDVLRDLGFEIPLQPTAKDSRRLHDKFIGLLTSKPMERLAQMPAMSDEKALAASSLFASIMSTAYIANPPLFGIISYQGAILTFEFGLDVWSPFFVGTPAAEASYLIQFCKQLTEIIRGMLENPLTGRSRTKGLMMLTFVTPWFETKERGIEFARATYNSGYETGDWLYGSYGAALFASQGFAASVNLVEFQNQLTAYTTSLQKMGQVMTPYILAIYLQTAESFKENSPEPHKLNGTFFNEDEWLPGAIAANDLTNRHFLSISKLIIAYHFDVDDKLDETIGEAEDLLVGGPCHMTFAMNMLVKRRIY